MIRLAPALLAMAMALPAPACTEDILLDLIGRLEAPGGYGAVHHAVRVPPPRALETMTVGEVLAWQRTAVRGGSVSSAAGRYQIIRPTLRRLAAAGVVDPSTTFDAAVQDRLARHLLRETGYRNGDTSAATANRIAAVWASLPRLGGDGAGRSMYEGVAGNHALVGARSFAGILDCSLNVGDVAAETAAVRAGRTFGMAWDRFLEDIARTAERTLAAVASRATGLLLALFTLDIALRAGRAAVTGGGARTLPAAIAMRLPVVCLCLAVLMAPGAFITAIDAVADTIAGGTGVGAAFSLSDHLAGRMALVLSLTEGMMVAPKTLQATVLALAVLTLLASGLLTATVVWWGARFVLAGAAGLLALGFGGLRETSGNARAAVMHLLATGLGLAVLLLVAAVSLDMAWAARSVTEPVTAAVTLFLLETVAAVLALLLPPAAAGLVR